MKIILLLKPKSGSFLKSELERWLLISVLFSIVLLSIRIALTGEFLFTFLIWNLFLAFIPYAISKWLSRNIDCVHGRLKFSIIFTIWLLFIPNSFYIMTDLFHLDSFINIPLWFDLTIILSFAWNGLLLGILSVRQMEKMLEDYFFKRTELLFIYPVMFLNALGVYIGRYLRFNSWDIVSNPFQLLKDISDLVLHPFQYKYVWGMVICFSVFMTLIYILLKKLSDANGR